jgi:hypothetical protein
LPFCPAASAQWAIRTKRIADEGLGTKYAFNGFAGALEAIPDFIDLRKVMNRNDVQQLLGCLDEHRARFQFLPLPGVHIWSPRK